MPIQRHRAQRNVLRQRISPQERASICHAIQRELALEYFGRTNAKREAWARLVIGLPPFPKSIFRERSR
jgi:hypothetical protein